jgi:hypothetical protein
MKRRLLKSQGLKKFALCGIVAGLCAGQKLDAQVAESRGGSAVKEDPNAGNLGYHVMTEDELLLELNDEGYKLYMSLDPEGKKLAREVASSRCDHANSCKGLNACATDKNACMGQGACKGQSKCGISDKNLAIKLVAKKLAAEKREKAVRPQNHH